MQVTSGLLQSGSISLLVALSGLGCPLWVKSRRRAPRVVGLVPEADEKCQLECRERTHLVPVLQKNSARYLVRLDSLIAS
jgi:hypothetical protein